jgi:amidase
MSSPFVIADTVGAWVPHGRFVVPGAASGPLAHLTFAAKDVYDVAHHPTGAGNPAWLATHPVPATSSPVIDTLLAAGATLVGKTVTDELAYSIHGDNIHYGSPINSNAPDRVTGGSSSGSVAAVAARLCDFALGTDTGGSTRVPASYCGVWGLRTTHGLLPREGLVPLHPSFDTVTWFAHDAETFERVAAVLMPQRPELPFSRALWLEDAAAEADALFEPALRLVQDALALPTSRCRLAENLEAWRQIYVTAGAEEGWRVHGAWITANRPQFAAPIEARWKFASTVSADAAEEARREVARIRRYVRATLGEDGVAVLPSAAGVAPLRSATGREVEEARTRTLRITCIAGLAGLPQVSIPLRTPDGLPIGVSLLGPAGRDLDLVRLAVAVGRHLRR